VDSKYLLGIEELDAQHEGIETLFNALQEAIEDKAQWPRLPELFASLCEKLKFHFYAEESIMQIFSYPESQDHKRSHNEILKSLESFNGGNLNKAEIKKLKEQPMQLFLEQILTQDMRFAAFIQRNRSRLGLP
jgi:hemerythrin-like metal-binding protein